MPSSGLVFLFLLPLFPHFQLRNFQTVVVTDGCRSYAINSYQDNITTATASPPALVGTSVDGLSAMASASRRQVYSLTPSGCQSTAQGTSSICDSVQALPQRTRSLSTRCPSSERTVKALSNFVPTTPWLLRSSDSTCYNASQLTEIPRAVSPH